MSPMARTGPAPLEDERIWIPATLEEAREIYARAVADGVPVSQARGLVAWLITLPERRCDDPTTDTQRSRYRQILHRLGRPPRDHLRFEDKGAYISSLDAAKGGTSRRDRRSRRWGRPLALLERIAS